MQDNFINPMINQGVFEDNKTKITSHWIKVTNSVYKLLDFFPDSDPLKNKSKEKALAILEGLTLISNVKGWVSLKNYFSENRDKAIEQLFYDIEVLENYLKIGNYQGWLNSINFLIIIKEYQKLKNEVNHIKSNNKNLEIFSNIKLEAKNTIVEQNSLSRQNPVVGEIPKAGKSLVQGTSYSERQNPPSYKISARQEKILQILSNREKTQVADIIKEIPNVTKRTLRRDLDDLLKKNTIVRVGEWNQVFYKILKNDRQHQKNTGMEIMQDGKMIPVVVKHSINDLAQFFDYHNGTFANNYNPELADKIRKISLPEQIISIDQLEGIIKGSLTSEEQIIISRHLRERIDELRNES